MTAASLSIPEQLSLFGQRWHARRASFCRPDALFDPRRAAVEEIDEASAKAFVIGTHYSGSYPAARYRAGLFMKRPFERAALVGVGVFSVPMTQSVIPHYFAGLAPAEGVELGRFVLAPEVAYNGESWSIARMFRLLHQALPEVRGVLAYCDPVERRDEFGVLVKRGHVGTIYKATNAHYRGLSQARTLWLAPNGASLAERLLSKIRLGESGERYALERLASLGAPRRALHEAGTDYVDRLKSSEWITPVRHPGNLAFTWSF